MLSEQDIKDYEDFVAKGKPGGYIGWRTRMSNLCDDAREARVLLAQMVGALEALNWQGRRVPPPKDRPELSGACCIWCNRWKEDGHAEGCPFLVLAACCEALGKEETP